MAKQGKKGPRKVANANQPVKVTINNPAPKQAAAKKQNGNGKQKSPKKDQEHLRGIQQGVGHLPSKPWGGKANYNSRSVFNALSYQHLPLPRAVGGYLVIRLNTRIQSNQRVILFGAFRGLDSTGKLSWTTNCAVNSIANPVPPSDGILEQGNTGFIRYSLTGSAEATLTNSLVVPSAVTVQIMNPEAVQTSTGIITASRAFQVLDWAGETSSWTTKVEQLQSYTSPRLMSAAKLAFRGVRIDAIPYNMNSLSDFRPFNQGAQGQTAWVRDTDTPDLDGFAPIWVYNPSQVNLDYLITTEYRVRFDPENPAHAAHTQYPVASDVTWQKHINSMTQEGHGVKDIADTSSGQPV